MTIRTLLLSVALLAPQTSAPPANDLYRTQVLPDGAIVLTNRDGAQSTFRPSFTVIVRTDDPGLKTMSDDATNFKVPGWTLPGAAGSTNGAGVTNGASGTNAANAAGVTMAFYKAGERIETIASSHAVRDGRIVWEFPENARFKLTASVALPDVAAKDGGAEPRVSFTFVPKRAGWYSIGYTGAPAIAPAAAESIWQPLVWQERRFPNDSYLSMEHMCPVPAVMVGQGGTIASVIADPSEIPFRLPTFQNARFGVLVRNATGQAQPQIFAPVLGREASAMKPGAPFSFTFRLLVRKGDWLDAYRYVARAIFGFHDYRQNATASLNTTIENMIDFAMNDRYSAWNEELRGFDYTTDVKGTVKVVSALHPLSLALVTDDPEIYARRARPLIEYLMSREKYLFAQDEKHEEHQNPSHLLKGPAAEVSELAALYLMSQERTPVLSHYAEALYGKPRALNLLMVSEGDSWQNALALYRLTRKEEYLRKAIAGAAAYVQQRITTPQTDFSDAHIMGGAGGQFWTDFSPKWIDLLELYETTRDRRFLDASVAGAKIYTTYVWLQPAVPAQDVLINPDGVAGIGDRHNKPDPQPMPAPAYRVPAWRVSQVGLTPEASNTYNGNPAVFLTHFAAYMLRLAHYTGDEFFKDVARSAVVGRYTNYPGYDINVAYTTIYQRPDYPLRSWNELTYNQFYYNHVWPHIALLADYLVTDALYKSNGRIDFPSRYAQGYAYLQSKVYGDRPGTFYDDKDVRLWMPAKLLDTGNLQINYVAGRGKDAQGNDTLYVALLNQSDAPQRATVRLNSDIVPVEWSRAYPVRVWQDAQDGQDRQDRQSGKDVRLRADAVMKGGEIAVGVAPNGITAIAIQGLRPVTRLQDHVFDASAAPLSPRSYAQRATPFGNVTAMLLSMGSSLTNAYIWLEATEQVLSEVTFHYRTPGMPAGEWKTINDTRYPYELSFPLGEKEAGVELWIEGKTPAGQPVKTDTIRLER
jgi:hypothetical protein